MRRSCLLLGLSVVFVGCAAESEPASDADIERASHGWRAATAAMDEAIAQRIDHEETDDGFSIRVACPEGGEDELVGVSDVQTGAEGFSSTFSATFRFEACGSQSVRIDGELSMSGESSAERDAVEYVGELQFSGAVQMRCIVDLSASTSTQIDGTNVSVQSQVSGSVCGVDAELAAGFES